MERIPTTDDPARQSAPAVERRIADRRAVRPSTHVVLRQIIDRLSDGVIVVSGDGRIRFANPAAERLFRRPAKDLVGQEFGYPLSTVEATEIEIVQRGSGVVVAELRLVDVDWEDEPAVLVSLRDVTDRKQAEERERLLESERRARTEAEAANQAKSDFLAVMSHELRTPLNAVIGYAELLDLGVVGAVSADQRLQIARITASGRHLLGLVNEILDLAKVEAGRLSVERRPASVVDVVDAAIVLSQPLAEARGMRLGALDEIPRDLQFTGDRDRVLQILTNLLSNAVKFTDPGGTIRIETARVAVSTLRHLHGEGPWITVSVSDSGIGIAAEQIESMFSPFVQADKGHTRRSDGTGLGLTISRRLARLMRGDVTVHSAPGEGSTFTLWLPGAAPDTMADSVVAALRTPANGSAVIPRTRGLAEIGDTMVQEAESILDAFVSRLRGEPSMSAAPSLHYSQLVDHSGALLADIAAALIALDDSEGAPSTLLSDSAEIQRFIADRHGLQRARLGWTGDALAREFVILHDEVERAVSRFFHAPEFAAQKEEALGVIRRLLEQATETSRRALERATVQADRRGDRSAQTSP